MTSDPLRAVRDFPAGRPPDQRPIDSVFAILPEPPGSIESNSLTSSVSANRRGLRRRLHEARGRASAKMTATRASDRLRKPQTSITNPSDRGEQFPDQESFAEPVGGIWPDRLLRTLIGNRKSPFSVPAVAAAPYPDSPN
jgi:hypothetical protein